MTKTWFSKGVINCCSCYVIPRKNRRMHAELKFSWIPFSFLVIWTFFTPNHSYTAFYLLLLYQRWSLLLHFAGKNSVCVSDRRSRGWVGHLSISGRTFFLHLHIKCFKKCKKCSMLCRLWCYTFMRTWQFLHIFETLWLFGFTNHYWGNFFDLSALQYISTVIYLLCCHVSPIKSSVLFGKRHLFHYS